MALTKYVSFHWESHDVLLTSGYPTVQGESRPRAAYLRSTATAWIAHNNGEKHGHVGANIT